MSGSGEPGRVPEPKNRARASKRSALSRVLLSLFGLVVVAAILAGAVGFYGYTKLVQPGPLAASKIYMVEAGQGQQEIGAALEKEGIVSSGALFAAGAYANGLRGQKLKPGEYEFPAAASIEQVLAIISSGKAILYKLTVPEGWTAQMAVARINENDVLTGDPVVPPAEGSIMPDTYVFRRGMTRSKLLADMQAAQTKLINQLWEERDQSVPLKSREEAVTLASIVEKETGVGTERPLVASVFMNRLKQGIRLQSDPTIIYGIVGGKGRLDRGLTKDDIATETPYNTYRISGLPPGPIANPGRAALEAVLNPPSTSYVYFVANGTGGHAFATTLAEHNANVAKWRALGSGQATVVTTDAAATDAAASTGMPALPAAKPAVPEATAEGQSAPAQPVASEVAEAPPAGAEPTVPASEASAAPVPAPQSETVAPVAAAVPTPAAPEAQAPAVPPVQSVAQEPAAAAPPPPPEGQAGTAAATAPAETQPATAAASATSEAPIIPKPVAKPAVPTTAVASRTVLQPGTVVKVADQMIPIPRQKPKK